VVDKVLPVQQTYTLEEIKRAFMRFAQWDHSQSVEPELQMWYWFLEELKKENNE